MNTLSHLSEESRIRVMVQQGIFLHSICYQGKEADLYSLDGDWVEVLVCPFSNKIISVNTIEYTALDKYLNGSMPELLQ